MIVHKTKAAMPGRLSHNALLKHRQITKLVAGGQRMSQLNFEDADFIQLLWRNSKVNFAYKSLIISFFLTLRTGTGGQNFIQLNIEHADFIQLFSYPLDFLRCSFLRFLRNDSRANSTGLKSGFSGDALLGFGCFAISQPSGSDLAFLRCSDLSLRPQASSTHAEKLAPGLSCFSRSTLASISSTTLCGNRIPLYVVLLVIWALAISISRYRLNKIEDTSKLALMELFKRHELTCLNNVDNLFKQGGEVYHPDITKPGSGGTLTGPLTTSDRTSIEVAMSNRITPLTGGASLSPDLFLWRFLALNRHDKKAKPCRLSVEAATEREARRILAPHFILSLSARLPLVEVSHV